MVQPEVVQPEMVQPEMIQPPPERASRLRSMTDAVPNDIRSQMVPGETAYHFAWISVKGGCQSMFQSAEDWLLITDRRVLYEASINDKEGGVQRFIRRTGSVPVRKIGFVEVDSGTRLEGCNYVKFSQLKISSGGSSLCILIPTETEALRCQRIIDELIATHD
jgi:hypothetical protein